MPDLIDLSERGRLPDALIRAGIRRLLAARLETERGASYDEQSQRQRAQLAALARGPVAERTDAANEQHYELPPEFFSLCLGPRMKYSSALWPAGCEDLAAAEDAMLGLTAERAALEDGQSVLELGCGWGSLSLWMAARYPRSRFVCVSNSASQRRFVLARGARQALGNLEVVTADMRDFDTAARYDRIVSVEMFEHMSNYRELMRRIGGWLRPGGRAFVHVFCHRELSYPFRVRGRTDWMARYFFTGGTMPAADTLLHFQEALSIEARWLISGRHYERTCNAWLARLDARRREARKALATVYGPTEADRWLQRWRMFFMACAELFGYRDGREWLVAHYRFAKRPSPAALSP